MRADESKHVHERKISMNVSRVNQSRDDNPTLTLDMKRVRLNATIKKSDTTASLMDGEGDSQMSVRKEAKADKVGGVAGWGWCVL